MSESKKTRGRIIVDDPLRRAHNLIEDRVNSDTVRFECRNGAVYRIKLNENGYGLHLVKISGPRPNAEQIQVTPNASNSININ
jgi:hypothetical protein